MRRFLFILGCITIIINPIHIYSQDNLHFIDTNKLWSILHYPYMKYPQHTTHYLKIGSTITVIDTSYFKLLRSDDIDHEEWYDYGLIREDSLGRVYYRLSNSTSEGLIYNNNAQKGDTLTIARRVNENTLFLFEITIDSIDTCLSPLLIGQLTFRLQ